jgi:hypothetical protein
MNRRVQRNVPQVLADASCHALSGNVMMTLAGPPSCVSPPSWYRCQAAGASAGAQLLIHQIGVDRADAIEAGLSDARRLEGRFVLDEWAPARYHILPAFSERDGFIALTGLDREFGRITLLRNQDRCVVMVGGTAKPFV